MRPYLFGLFAIILFGLWWYLDTLLATQGWATMEGGQWGPTSTGWKIIPAAWPLALVGVLGGGHQLFLKVCNLLAVILVLHVVPCHEN